MENKARKMFAAVVVIMLCAVAIVGIGYAYNASTTNSGNTATSEYVTLTQIANGESQGQYTFTNDNQKIYYNTNTTSNDGGTTVVTTYTLDNERTVNTSYKAVVLGKSFKIQATQTGGTYENMTCTVTKTAGSVSFNGEWKILLHVTTKDDSLADQEQWIVYDGSEFSSTFTIYKNSTSEPTGYNLAAVEVYFGYVANNPPTTAPNATPLNGVSFAFTATHTGSNVAPSEP